MTRFRLWSLGIGVAFIVLTGWLVDRSQMVRKLNQELNQERKERQRASDMALSATKAYHDAEAMIDQYRAEGQKQYDARAQIARMLPVTPELKIAHFQAELSQTRETFLELGRLGASFRAFQFYYGDFTGAELGIEGGEVTDELATKLTYCGLQRISMSEVTMADDAKAILTERYDHSFENGIHIFQLREQVRPPLAR